MRYDDAMEDDLLIRRLAALGQTQRMRIYVAVSGSGSVGVSPSLLAERLALSHSLVSAHIVKLVACGLLMRSEEGGRVTLVASPEAKLALLQPLEGLLGT